MSLPQAKKDIATKPAAGSVVDPVNKDLKDADVDRKLRLYGVVEAFRQGRMPDNAQIDETLSYLTAHSPVDLDALSPDGQRLVQDVRDIVETARVIVKKKNKDELFQNFVWHTRDVDAERAKKDPGEVLPVDKEKAKNDGQEAVKHLRTLLTLVLTNSEVRKLLSDFSLIGRDLLSKSAAKAAGALAPPEDQLAQTDEAAPRDQFISEGGRRVGPNETPVLEAKVPDPRPGREGATVRQHPKESVGQGTAVEVDGQVKSGDQVAREAGEKKEQVKGRAQAEARAQAEDVNDEGDAKNKAGGLMDKMRDLKNNAFDRVPQEHKDKAGDQFEKGKKFLSEEYFPEERRDQFIFRGKKVIIECQKHQDYQESIRWLISYVEEYARHGKHLAKEGKNSGDQLAGDGSLRTATAELRTLLERFANGVSMEGILGAVDALVEDARTDGELREWFGKVDGYVRKVLLQAGYVLEDESTTEGREVKESGRRFYDEKYKNHFDNLFGQIGDWFKEMGEDPLNKRFGQDWARLTKDLLFDSEGSLKFKPELWNDVRKVILPELVDQVGYVPIPRIEYTDKEIDLVIENLVLSGRNIFPNYVTLEAHNYMKFSPYNAISDDSRHEFTLTLGQIQADMRDVAFYFRKKTGIPKLSDWGLADVLLGGSGMTATVHLASAGKDRSSVFKVKDVNVKVDTLKFSIRDSKHDLLYKTLRPLATGLVKKQIQKAVEDALTTGLEYVDGQLVSVRDRYNEAKASDEKSRKEALQELFQSKKEEASSKASTAESKKNERDSHFKMVAKRDSMIVQEGTPARFVDKTNERAEAAVKGREWHSDAFSIVGTSVKRNVGGSA